MAIFLIVEVLYKFAVIIIELVILELVIKE